MFHRLKLFTAVLTLSLFAISCLEEDLGSYTLSFFQIKKYIDYETIVNNSSNEIQQLVDSYISNPIAFDTTHKEIELRTENISEAGYTKKVEFIFGSTQEGVQVNTNKLGGSFILKTNFKTIKTLGAKNMVELRMFRINQYNGEARQGTSRSKMDYFINMYMNFETNASVAYTANGKIWISNIDTVAYTATRTITFTDSSKLYKGNSVVASSYFFDEGKFDDSSELIQLDSSSIFRSGKQNLSIGTNSVAIDYGQITDADNNVGFAYLQFSSIEDLKTVLNYDNGK